MNASPTTPALPSESSEVLNASLMTSLEKRSSISLAAIYGLRMLGLFLVLPVFAIEAAHYPGGDDPALVGLAMGIYGLTQGALQLAFGAASDKLGRKKVIVFGLLSCQCSATQSYLHHEYATIGLFHKISNEVAKNLDDEY